ncbi:S9 family peptidase [Microbulbifer bruguierae]|uniref:S9 family peptidase n=1 Tax=Microbulbifer bruguierae TaxID=3029061 RepID=A0ABY8NE30_9GAMM|nr:S9 family peptidase [Microbulbifer bruguierae]WGL15708.1 S9 family peptidase [Microbulbifer bruguierae]
MDRNWRVIGVFAIAGLIAACAPKQEDASTATDTVSETIQATPLIDRELLFGNPTRWQGRLSPDGEMMSFLAPVDGVLNVWVAPAGNFDAAKVVTADTGRGIRQHFWSLDSESLLFIRDNNGDENWHLFSVDLQTDEITDLTPYEDISATMIAQSEDHPGQVVVGINDRDPRWHDPYLIDLQTAERKLLVENTGFAELVVDHDLQVRLGLTPSADGGFTVSQKIEDDWVALFDIPREDALTTQILGFDKDNSGIYLQDSRGRDKAALTHLALASGKITVLAESDKADISSVVMNPTDHSPMAYAVNFHKHEWVGLNENVKVDVAALNKQANGDITILATTLDGMQWLTASARDTESDVYEVFDRNTQTLTTLFEGKPELNEFALPHSYPLTIQSRDGLDLVSYLTLPVEADKGGHVDAPIPMVLLVHGGPWSRDNFADDAAATWLANRGYAVLQVNYRASTGFGKNFVNAGNGEWAAAMHNDLLDAVDWAIDKKITRKDQVAIMGGSYGGYATLVGLTFTPETFACGVDIVGPSNLNTLLDSVPPYWEGFKKVLHSAVGNPETEAGRKLLEERSPLNFVDNISKPLLIGQGANDPRVKQAESDQIVSAMQAKQLPVTYILYPDEGHGFQKPENRLSFFAATESFLADCLGGRYQPIGNDLSNSSIEVVQGIEFVPGLKEAVMKHSLLATNAVEED